MAQFDQWTSFALRADDPAWLVLGVRWPDPLADRGPSNPMQIMVGPAVPLCVVVRDTHGRPIAGMPVRVWLDESENSAVCGPDPGYWQSHGRAGTEPRASTDAEGHARFPSIWLNRRLVFRIGEHRADEERDGVLMATRDADERPPLRPIVLAPGGERRFEVRLPATGTVAGRVVSAGGAPGSYDRVFVYEIDADRGATLFGSSRTDADGRFAISFRGRARGGRLHVLARTGGLLSPRARRWLPRGRSMTTALDSPGDGPLAHLELTPGALQTGRAEVELVAAPSLAITGRVLRPEDRSPCADAVVWITPIGAADHHIPCTVPRTPTPVREDGVFEAYGLVPGRYDLWVVRAGGSVHRFSNVAAGARDLELPLPSRGEVRVDLRAQGGDVDEMLVRVTRHVGPIGPEANRAAPPSITVSGDTGWGVGHAWTTSGHGGSYTFRRSGPGGEWAVDCKSIEGARHHELRGLDPGWYSFGIRAQGSRCSYAFAETDAAWFEPGGYTVHFELRPATTVTGRIELPTPSGMSHVLCLLTPDGRPIPLKEGALAGGFVDALPISASGRFVLRDVPVGDFRLRVHSAADVGTDDFRREVPVRILARDTPEIVIF